LTPLLLPAEQTGLGDPIWPMTTPLGQIERSASGRNDFKLWKRYGSWSLTMAAFPWTPTVLALTAKLAHLPSFAATNAPINVIAESPTPCTR